MPLGVTPTVIIKVSGARGESQADILRRTGQYGVLPGDTDAQVMAKLNAAAELAADNAEKSAAVFRLGAPGTEATKGIVPLFRGGANRLVQWFDQRRAIMRSAGDGFTGSQQRRGGWRVPFLDRAGGAVAGIAADGEFYAPGGVTAPLTHIDNGQLWVIDGAANRQISICESPVKARKGAAPGLARYGCADGSIRHASWRGTGVDTADDGFLRIVMGIGQSLIDGGVNSNPQAFLTAPPSAEVLMWQQGVIPAGPGQATALTPAGFTSLVPAYEQIAAPPFAANFGETGLVALAWALNGPSGRAGGSTYHVASFGKGNTAYSGIKKGTQPYANAMASLTALKTWCAANGKVPRIEAVIFDHGENDFAAGVTEATYAGYMAELLSDLTADITALGGISNAGSFAMFTMQKGLFASSVLGGSPAAQASAPLTNARIQCVGPQYMVDYEDLFHPYSQWHRTRMAYYAKAIRDLTLGQQDAFRPLRMLSGEVYGRWGRVVFDVAHPPIRLDDMIVSDPGSAGLSYSDAGAASIVPGSVRVDGHNALEFELTTGRSGTGKIRTAWFAGTNSNQGRAAGPRSIIHDSCMEACPATGRLLHNYALHQEITAS